MHLPQPQVIFVTPALYPAEVVPLFDVTLSVEEKFHNVFVIQYVCWFGRLWEVCTQNTSKVRWAHRSVKGHSHMV